MVTKNQTNVINSQYAGNEAYQAPPVEAYHAPGGSEKRGLHTVIEEIRTAATEVERCLAGYYCLSQSLASVKGEAVPGQRRRGLPILSYPGTVDGVHKVDVALDLKEVDPAYVEQVLAPLIHAHARLLLQAATEGRVLFEELIASVSQQFGQAAPVGVPRGRQP